MWDRLLCAIDQFESGQKALAFAADVASANQASVRVLHIRELSKMAHVLPLETPSEAEDLVRRGSAGVGIVGGRSRGTVLLHVGG